MRRTLLIATAAGALALPAAAGAHVSLHPNTLPASSSPTINVRVPNEEDKASTVKVDMQIPPGFLDVSTQLPPGWRDSVIKRKLATPIKTDAGTVTEEVAEVIWAAPANGGIPPGSFLQFPITTAIPDADAGQTLTFKVIQTYSNRDVVRWIEAPNSMNHPAPTVIVTPKGGLIEDVSGTEAGPGPVPSTTGTPPGSTEARAATTTGASKGLGIAALILGVLALLVALGAIARGRPRGA